jgi:hypothetical protein
MQFYQLKRREFALVLSARNAHSKRHYTIPKNLPTMHRSRPPENQVPL